GLVLPGNLSPSMSLITAFVLCGIPLLLRLSLRSWRVFKFITLFRLDFVYDSVIMILGVGFLSRALCDDGSSESILRTMPMIIALMLLYLDWRTSDALVLPLALNPYRPEFAIPV